MRCPVFEHARLSYDDVLSEQVGECIKEKCEFYMKSEPRCCVPFIAEHLAEVTNLYFLEYAKKAHKD